jgi:hypothetical protein
MTEHQTLPPRIPVLEHGGAVALRSPGESALSASFVLGHQLVLEVRDVRTNRPIRLGGYLRSCRITVGDETDEYVCPDGERYPRAARFRESYEGNSGAATRQRTRFYNYVSFALKRLGYWTGPVPSDYSPELDRKMRVFHQAHTGKALERILEVLHLLLDDCEIDGYIEIPLTIRLLNLSRHQAVLVTSAIKQHG